MKTTSISKKLEANLQIKEKFGQINIDRNGVVKLENQNKGVTLQLRMSF